MRHLAFPTHRILDPAAAITPADSENVSSRCRLYELTIMFLYSSDYFGLEDVEREQVAVGLCTNSITLLETYLVIY